MQETQVDFTTKGILSSAQLIVRYVGDRFHDLPPKIKTHINGYKEFIDLVESGQIKHWYQFFKVREDYLKK